MALPKALEPSLSPDELTFLAEEDAIDIVPLFSMSRVRLLSVSAGPSDLVHSLGHVKLKLCLRESMVHFGRPQLAVYRYGWRCR